MTIFVKKTMKKLVIFLSLHVMIFSFMVITSSCGNKKVIKDSNERIISKRVNDCVVKGFRLTTGKRQRFITTLEMPNGKFIEIKTIGLTFNIGDTVDVDVKGNLVKPVLDSLNVTKIIGTL